MRERTLYIIIGTLIGVIIMQWRQGPQPVQAQAPSTVTSLLEWPATNTHIVVLDNGDVFRNHLTYSPEDFWRYETPPEYLGNFFSGPPVPTTNESWGSIKAKSK